MWVRKNEPASIALPLLEKWKLKVIKFKSVPVVSGRGKLKLSSSAFLLSFSLSFFFFFFADSLWGLQNLSSPNQGLNLGLINESDEA